MAGKGTKHTGRTDRLYPQEANRTEVTALRCHWRVLKYFPTYARLDMAYAREKDVV